MYKIAKWLTETEKRRACDATYHSAHPTWAPRMSPGGYCPMGEAFRGTGAAALPTNIDSIPPLLERAIAQGATRLIERALLRFINDWDRGKITDLDKALGFRRALGTNGGNADGS